MGGDEAWVVFIPNITDSCPGVISGHIAPSGFGLRGVTKIKISF